jgi:hypothetical protein
MSQYTFNNNGPHLGNVNGSPGNIDGSHVNATNSSYAGGFGSNETSLQFGLPSIRNNVAAAAASQISGGGRKKTKSLRRKIKNITNKYRMSRTKRNSIRKRLRSKYTRGRKTRSGRKTKSFRRLTCSKKHKHKQTCYCNKCLSTSCVCKRHKSGKKRRSSKTMKQRGGYYAQFSNDIPNTPSYSTGGILSPQDSALANPTPMHLLSNDTNCIDNYDYNTNNGFQYW